MILIKWQNLIHKKCPKCDARFLPHPKGYFCPDDACAFFITKKRLVEILTDHTHPAIRFASDHELDILDEALRELGINPQDIWRAPAIDVVK